jgi:hypothetical protein
MRKVKGRNGGTLTVREKGDPAPPNVGRKKKLPQLDILLADILGGGEENSDGAMQILRALHKKAMDGDVRAAEVLLSRGYGLPKQQIEHTGKDDKPIEVKEWVIVLQPNDDIPTDGTK